MARDVEKGLLNEDKADGIRLREKAHQYRPAQNSRYQRKKFYKTILKNSPNSEQQ